MDYILDPIRPVYEWITDKIGQEWTVILIAVLVVAAMYLVILRGK